MITRIDIRDEALDEHVEQALQWIRAGLIIAAPLENGYVYLAEAFDHDAVRAMHVLREDPLGVAAQVLISGNEVIDGIARQISADARLLISKFWPGQLSMNLLPQQGLSWDLGDAKRLDQVCVRVPSAEFVLALLKRSGPLAVASAAHVGSAPILDPEDISAREYDVAGIFDAGLLTSGAASTLVSDSETGIKVLREGAVSIEQLRELLPDIEAPGSSNSQPSQ